MKRYKTTAILNLHAGNLQLDKDQLRRRRHLVADNKDGTVAIMKPVQFKVGEEFGYDGDIPKILADDLTEVPGVDDAPTFPVHKGAGVWELSNGERVKGKSAAFDAEERLAEASE